MLSKITNISTLLTQNTTFIVTARKFLRLLQKKEPCPCLNLKMNYFRGHIIPMLTSCPDLVGRLVFKVSSTCCSWSPASSTTSTQSSTRSSTPFSPGSQTHQLRLFMSITLTLSGDFEEDFLTFTQNAGIVRCNIGPFNDNDDAALESMS